MMGAILRNIQHEKRPMLNLGRQGENISMQYKVMIVSLIVSIEKIGGDRGC